MTYDPKEDEGRERPGDRRPDPGDFADEETPRLELPPVLPSPGSREPSGVYVVLTGFRFRGNTVFGDDILSKVTLGWIGRPIDYEDLIDVADAVTRFYNNAGYVSSGAVIPDQSVDGQAHPRSF